MYLQQGYTRLIFQEDIIRIEDFMAEKNNLKTDPKDLFLVIDRLAVDDNADFISRLIDSAETAFFRGDGTCKLMFMPSNATYDFSMRFESDGMTFEDLNDNMFSFNSPLGACPKCEGFGKIIGIDESLVIPNTSLSVYENY